MDATTERWIPMREFAARLDGLGVNAWTIRTLAKKGKFGEDCTEPGGVTRERWFRADAWERMLAREAQRKGA